MSPQAYLIDPFLRIGKWLGSDGDADMARVMNRAQLNLIGLLSRAPWNFTVRQQIVAGVPCEFIFKQSHVGSPAVVMLVHGGGFIAGSPASHREIAWRLCEYTDVPVISVDYRLAPEHRYPAQLEDVVAVYSALLEQGVTQIAVVGDSAGGNLALTLALACRDTFVQPPTAIACFSPWTDLTNSGDSVKEKARRDPVIATQQLDPIAGLYCGTADVTNPLISPLFADLCGFPPLQLHAGTDEILLDDTVRFADRAQTAGVEVDCRIWVAAPHSAPLFANIVPEGRAMLRETAKFLRAHLGVEPSAELLQKNRQVDVGGVVKNGDRSGQSSLHTA